MGGRKWDGLNDGPVPLSSVDEEASLVAFAVRWCGVGVG